MGPLCAAAVTSKPIAQVAIGREQAVSSFFLKG
jgi:hypothetical protein